MEVLKKAALAASLLDSDQKLTLATTERDI